MSTGSSDRTVGEGERTERANRGLWLPWILLLAIAASIRLPVLAAPLEHLVTVLPDDAFYYFEVAQRAVRSGGLTFDGSDLADGFQPLWMLLLLPFAWLPKLAFVKAGLALGIACHLVAVGLLGRATYLLSQSHAAALLAGSIYTFNRWALMSSVNGLETALTSALFCTCLVIVVRLACCEKTQRLSTMSPYTLGLAIALLFLARTDQLFYCLALLTLAVALVPNPRWLLTVAVTGLAIAVPWFVWHWWLSGSPLPSSGTAQPLIMRTLADIHGNDADQGFIALRGFFTGGIFSFTGFDRRLLAPLLTAAALIVMIRYRSTPARLRFGFLAVALLGSAGFALGFVHTYWRWYPRTWYFDQYILLIALLLSLSASVLLQLLADLRSRHRPLAWLRFAPVTLLGLAAIPLWQAAHTGVNAITGGNYLHQRQVLDAALWLEANAPPNSVVAGWNSGITAFALEQPVLNLDGAISASTLPYLEQRNLSALLCRRKVSYVLDHAGDINRFQPFLPGYPLYTTAEPIRFLLRPGAGAVLVQPLSSAALAKHCGGFGSEAPN